ncbi:hypothetical protein FOL46_000449 [Perkinsus olseni]|uniref:Uncharacterized protein n=1 Tax=Perkinsus olseni TaxID=32597 RepID=A0A7J6KVF0_PEROL|nr:hypothetical protein FOL46_000449 [Perkinsus olseni]
MGVFPHVVLLLLASLISAVTALQSGWAEMTRPTGDIHPGGLEMATKKLMPFLAAKLRSQNGRRVLMMITNADTCFMTSSDSSTLKMRHRNYGGGYSVQYTAPGAKPTSVTYWMKPNKMVELEYLRGKKGAKVSGPSQEIRSEFSEFIPFAQVADRIIQGFESGMNDTQCSRLNDHIETNPPAGYEKFGRDWLRMFVKEKFVKKAVKKLRKPGEAVLRDEQG